MKLPPSQAEVVSLPTSRGKRVLISAIDLPRVKELGALFAVPNRSLEFIASGRRCKWYVRFSRGGKLRYLHRFLTDCPPGLLVDHLDGDPFNCTRSNLKVTDAAGNAKTARPRQKRRAA